MRDHKQNWLDVFSGFRVALDARKILLGALGAYVTIIVLGGLLALAQYWWPGAETYKQRFLQDPIGTMPDLACTVSGKFCPAMAHPPVGLRDFTHRPAAALAELGHAVTEHAAYPIYGVREALFTACGCLLMLFIWSFFGGAIARIAAVDFAKDERLQIGEATEFAGRKFGSFFWAPLVPVVFVLILLLCNFVLGLVGRIPAAGPVIVGLLFGLAAISAFLVVLLLIGGILGFVFMWPTIAMEGTDAFDAISRAFNYLFARPWKTFWCWLMAAAYGLAVTAFVVLFTGLFLHLAVGSVGLGMGKDFGNIGSFLGAPQSVGLEVGMPYLIAMVLMKVVQILAWGLVLGFVVSYKVSAATIIYAVIRRDVDGTDMTEVYLPEKEEAPEVPPAPESKPETGEAKPETSSEKPAE